MNFLAHLYLSGDSDRLLIGNFIADFVKDNGIERYRGEIYHGILLHREIDAFTDRHRQVARSRRRLWPRHRHYSSVIVDIFYDHFLARNWREYSNISLPVFARRAYAVMQDFESLLPPRAQMVLPRMIANNWLVNYARLEGIDSAMRGMAQRASFPSLMEGAVADLQEEYPGFESDFRMFFPDLIAFVRTRMEALAAGPDQSEL